MSTDAVDTDRSPSAEIGERATSERMSDAALLRAVDRDDPGAFDAFVDRYGRRILAFGRRMCGHREDAEDVFQETLLRAYEGLGSLRDPGAVRTWLFRVAANACLMKRRKEARTPEISLEELGPPGWHEGRVIEVPDWSDLPEGSAVRAELRRALEAGFEEIPEDYRVVVLLRDVEGLSTRETADALGVREPAVKMRLHRGRMALRKILADRYAEMAARAEAS